MLTRSHLAVAVLAAFVAACTAAPAHASYGYPIAPFHSEHPIRGYFGDPRTVFFGPPTAETLAHSDGHFAFHEGVDISAPNGTAVYPVVSGRVVSVTHTEDWCIRVDTGGGVSFAYWHVTPSVRPGQRVTAYRTLLGHVQRPAGHVHLTQLVAGRPVNPLAPGRLEPFADTNAPQIRSLSFRQPGTVAELMPGFVRGSIDLVADAYDLPTLPVAGHWHGLPTMPALVTWRVQRWTGKVIVPERTAVDFRSIEPANAAFWSTYARGSYQNMCVFRPHYSFAQPGVYLLELTPRPFDTTSLRDGVYDLVVTASDLAGNRRSATRRFTVHNRSGWVGS
jgi:hypothetical protein